MKLIGFLLIASLAILPSGIRGEDESLQQSVFFDYLNLRQGGGFLHIPGLEFHNSMGFSFFSAGGMGSAAEGYYLGHFDLSLSSSLMLHWDIGIRSMMTGPEADGNPELFIPNVDLTYRPSGKLLLRLQYRQYRYPTSTLRRIH
jgi:hypothetical protein